MARLNEAAVPTESVDALKRRFIRQNRELAKNNSTQSNRIRCLEAEVSRLLAENLTLREEIIQLRNDAENVPSKSALTNVRKAMETKMTELGKLVAELGQLQKPATKNADGEMRQPSIGWGRGTAVETAGSDGRLPTIREDKSFPRRTLDAREIRNIAPVSVSTSSESPDLGSPPVSHFVDEDPIKFDQPSTSEPSPMEDPEKEPSDLPASLSVNLETRKKRRDSNSKLTIRRMSVFHSPPEKIEDAGGNGGGKAINQAPPVRAGSKRKLAAREEDAKVCSQPEEFTYSRRNSETSENAPEHSNAKTEPKPRVKKEVLTSVNLALPERKALGEKSINTDPVVSPQKPSKEAPTISDDKPIDRLKKPILPLAKDANKPKTLPRRPKPEAAPTSISIPPPTAPTVLDLPPKTPFAEDIFSPPPSTEPSTRRPPAARDTPPPADLDASDHGGRAGRRARAVVSYAEPSLISKMRRPGKELCDAVGRDGRPLSVTLPGNGHASAKGVTIKTEPVSDEEVMGWQKGADTDVGNGSPLSKKSLSSSLLPEQDPRPIPASTTTARENTTKKPIRQQPPGPTSSAAAIQALTHSAIISSNRRKAQAQAQEKSQSQQQSQTQPQTQAPLEENPLEKPDLMTKSTAENKAKARIEAELAIYDFTSSSPPKNTTAAGGAVALGRGSRRHSYISTLHPGEAQKDKIAKVERHKGQSSIDSASTVVVSRSRPVSRTEERRDEGGKGGGGGGPEAGLGRSERAASRRRSMML
ncbi:hypothetical protein EJ08DRAFT_682956 [Tothia fuscella]|uniref:Shugoshin n=1 Tax=Tothia fuscella TaxID=1048955 RepID=A0A9P4TUA4_9PEZI|nr:hypothetical protein EJ08DRAFT_682956 [Tothia fuscella]